eukprot:7390985-Prymnesium_polylepis.2
MALVHQGLILVYLCVLVIKSCDVTCPEVCELYGVGKSASGEQQAAHEPNFELVPAQVLPSPADPNFWLSRVRCLPLFHLLCFHDASGPSRHLCVAALLHWLRAKDIPGGSGPFHACAFDYEEVLCSQVLSPIGDILWHVHNLAISSSTSPILSMRSCRAGLEALDVDSFACSASTSLV